jgi:hypothetical protein
VPLRPILSNGLPFSNVATAIFMPLWGNRFSAVNREEIHENLVSAQ